MTSSRALWRAGAALALTLSLDASIRPLPAQEPTRAEVRGWLADARTTIDSLARLGDVEAVGDRFAPNATIVLPDGSTLTGWSALHDHLLRLGRDPDRHLVGLRMMPSGVQQCVGATHEHGGEVTFIFASGSRLDSLGYRYAAEWLGAPPRDPIIGRLSLARLHDGNAPRRARCLSPEAHAMRHRRTIGVAILLPFPIGQYWSTVDDFTATLRDRGYGDGRLNNEQGVPFPGYRGTEEDEQTIGVGAAVRYTFHPPFSAELSGTFLPTRSTIQGHDDVDSHISLEQSSNLITGTVAYQWAMLRAGAGAAAVHSRWRIRENQIGRDGAFVAARGDKRFTTFAPGGVAQISVVVPMSRHAFFELRGQGWLTRDSRTEATDRFEAASVSTSGYFAAILIGVVR